MQEANFTRTLTPVQEPTAMCDKKENDENSLTRGQTEGALVMHALTHTGPSMQTGTREGKGRKWMRCGRKRWRGGERKGGKRKGEEKNNLKWAASSVYSPSMPQKVDRGVLPLVSALGSMCPLKV